jgi:hypothetical protein
MENNNYPLGAEHSVYAPFNQQAIYYCRECDAEMNADTHYCSTKCFNNSSR